MFSSLFEEDIDALQISVIMRSVSVDVINIPWK